MGCGNTDLQFFGQDALVENLVFESENPEIVSVTEGGVLEVHKTGITVIHVSWTGPYTEKGKTEDLGDLPESQTAFLSPFPLLSESRIRIFHPGNRGCCSGRRRGRLYICPV